MTEKTLISEMLQVPDPNVARPDHFPNNAYTVRTLRFIPSYASHLKTVRIMMEWFFLSLGRLQHRETHAPSPTLSATTFPNQILMSMRLRRFLPHGCGDHPHLTYKHPYITIPHWTHA